MGLTIVLTVPTIMAIDAFRTGQTGYGVAFGLVAAVLWATYIKCNWLAKR